MSLYKRIGILILVLSSLCLRALPQQHADNSRVIQLSGYVTDSLSGEPISFITVRIVGSRRGVITNSEGFFSIPAQKGDTLLFTAIGYVPHTLPIPRNLQGNKLLVTILMRPSVYTLRGLTIRALTRERFKYELLTVELPEMPMVNPAAFVRPGELKLPPPPPGIRFSPSEILEDIPFVERAIKKKRSKKFVEDSDPTEIPVMK